MKKIVCVLVAAAMAAMSVPALASKPSVSSFLELYAQRLTTESWMSGYLDTTPNVYARQDFMPGVTGMSFSDGYIKFDAGTSMITSVTIPIFCEGWEDSKNSEAMIKAYSVFAAVEKDSSEDAIMKSMYKYGVDGSYMDALDYGMEMINKIYGMLTMDTLTQLCVKKLDKTVMTTDVAEWTLSAVETYSAGVGNGKYIIYLTADILAD